MRWNKTAQAHNVLYEQYVQYAKESLDAALASFQSSNGEHLMTWDLLRAIDHIKLAYQLAEEYHSKKNPPARNQDEARLEYEGQEDKRMHEEEEKRR